MIVYVAGPMSGLPDYNYPAFVAAAADLVKAGYDVLNPTEVEGRNPTPGIPQPWGWYMRQALGMVLRADALAVLPGWECSRGAALEVQVAHALQMPVLPLAAWLGPTAGDGGEQP